jgi:5-methylcytosine-specific restriction protein A
MGGFTAELKKQIFDRDDWKCVRCLGAANDVHHRKLRGMGGSKLLNTPSNLISLCRKCHNWTHAHPADSYNAGYLVHSWDNPETIFIITKPGLLTLREDGTFTLQGSCDPYF